MGRQGARFVIQELLPVAAPYKGGEPERFEWDVEHRSMPKGVMNIGVQMRTKRRDYTGAEVPSEQILGAVFKDQTVSGSWLDKWNYIGFAEETYDRFERMVRRGNLCRIEFRGYSFTVLITDLDTPVRNDLEIGYSFKVSVHQRDDSTIIVGNQLTSTPVLDPRTRAAQVQNLVNDLSNTRSDRGVGDLQDVGAASLMPPSLQGGPIHAFAIKAVKQLDEQLQSLKSSIDSSIIDPAGDPAAALLTIASGFALVRAACQSTIDGLAGLISEDQAAMSAFDNISWEAWRLGLLSQLHAAMGVAYDGEREAVTQAKPGILRIHEAKDGDTLMSLAFRYYGAADSWPAIAQRNGIVDFTIYAGAYLIIPEGPRR